MHEIDTAAEVHLELFQTYMFEIFCENSYLQLLPLKGAEATCVKIATEIKKCSRLKEMSNFNVL